MSRGLRWSFGKASSEAEANQNASAICVNIDLWAPQAVFTIVSFAVFFILLSAEPFPAVRDALLPNLGMLFVLNADICSSFPLAELMDMHQRHRGVGTMMGVSVRQGSRCPNTHKLNA